LAGKGPTNHFQRSNERLSVLWRNSTFRKDTEKGYRCRNCKADRCPHWESHHIACNHAVEGRIISKNKAYVENCLWITDWDLNNNDNLIGLPKKRQYENSSGRSPINLCAHNIDHDHYTDDCKEWMKINIWDTLNDKQKDHDVKATDIQQQLKSCTTIFKTRLDTLGISNGGTLISYRNRFKTGWEDKWYEAFSMSLSPRKRNPGSMRDLNKLFNIIG